MSMSKSKENETVVEQLQEKVINEKKLGLLDELLTSDYVWHGPGRDAGREIYRSYLAAFPDLRLKVQERISVGDKVVTRYVAEGTHKGELEGVPASEKYVMGISGISISRIQDGRIAEVWESFDERGMMKQIRGEAELRESRLQQDLDATWNVPRPPRRPL